MSEKSKRSFHLQVDEEAGDWFLATTLMLSSFWMVPPENRGRPIDSLRFQAEILHHIA